MPILTLEVQPYRLSVHKFPPKTALPSAVFTAQFFSITRTADELSVVVSDDAILSAQYTEKGWRALKVQGQLDFSLVGILAKLSTTLAAADISIFAISTFDTDYILVQENSLAQAVDVLRQVGYQI